MNLTDPERRLVEAAKTGALLDLRSGDPFQDDPANAAYWPAERTIRAEVLADLLTTEPPNGRLHWIRLTGARVIGQLSLRAATLHHPLRLDVCVFDQPIDLTEAETRTIELFNCHFPILFAEHLRTRGSLDLAGARCAEIRLPGAHIEGQLRLLGGPQLSGVDGRAFYGDSLTVDHDVVFGEGFTATGDISLSSAQVGGQLRFEDADLDGAGVILRDARAHSVWLLWRTPPSGTVELTGAHVEYLEDSPSTWPKTLWLNGFSYQQLGTGDVTVRQRLDWVARHRGGFEPGPYDQLAAMYRREGRVEAARKVNITKHWRRRSVLGWPGKAWNWLLYLTVGYGYRPWLAGLWLILLALAGTLVLALRHPADFIATSAQPPDFQPLAYTLDVLLPFVDLGQQSTWLAQGAALACSWLLIVAGWVLATTVIAGVTNALRRD